MTDDATPTDLAHDAQQLWDPSNDPDGYTDGTVERKDWYLDVVLTVAHGGSDQHSEGLVGLTVTSNGAVVSGLAISRSAWIAGVAEQYQNSGASETATAIAETFDLLHNNAVNEASRRRDADLPTATRKFLHMRDARIGTGSDYIQLPYWRGSLVDITSWALGSWNPKRAETVRD